MNNNNKIGTDGYYGNENNIKDPKGNEALKDWEKTGNAAVDKRNDN